MKRIILMLLSFFFLFLTSCNSISNNYSSDLESYTINCSDGKTYELYFAFINCIGIKTDTDNIDKLYITTNVNFSKFLIVDEPEVVLDDILSKKPEYLFEYSTGYTLEEEPMHFLINTKSIYNLCVYSDKYTITIQRYLNYRYPNSSATFEQTFVYSSLTDFNETYESLLELIERY